jgi:isochorismate synthase
MISFFSLIKSLLNCNENHYHAQMDCLIKMKLVMNTLVTPPDLLPDLSRECVMQTQQGFLFSKGITASTEVEVDDVERLMLSVKQLFELARLRPSLVDKKAVVFGAIPFDNRGKAQFILPTDYHFVAKEKAQQLLNKRGSKVAASIIQQAYQPTQDQYQQAVRSALATFSKQTFTNGVLPENTSVDSPARLEKVVLGKQLHLTLSTPLEPASILTTLLDNNQTGYPFSLPLTSGVLLGVSPELLIRKSGDQLFTNPLAGSVKRHGQEKQEEWQSLALLQSVKDRHEHRLVVDDIATVLAPLCRELTVPAAPSILKTDSMLHLSTQISGYAMDASLSSLEVAMALHPTPAVCGYPTELARAFIADNEPDSRGYFAGLVGWCDEDGNGEWYIAIRCGLLNQNKVTLFAGAGIVAGSDPLAEWQETDAKIGTMLNALNLHPSMTYADRQEPQYAG